MGEEVRIEERESETISLDRARRRDRLVRLVRGRDELLKVCSRNSELVEGSQSDVVSNVESEVKVLRWGIEESPPLRERPLRCY